MLYARLVPRHSIRPHRILPYNFNCFNQNHHGHRQLLTLAIETSCDDTCVAVLECHSREENIVDNQGTARGLSGEDTASSPHLQAQLHFNEKVTLKNAGRGGIHPLDALQSHRSHLAKLIRKALQSLPLVTATLSGEYITCPDGTLRRKPDFVSVARGPGMRSNLACGLDTAKGLAIAWQVPLIGVHHMQAHTLTPRFISAMKPTDGLSGYQPGFPFLTLLVSGGHTMLLYSTTLTEHKVLASTRDVAIGDALDKCGRLLLSDDIKAEAPDTAFGKYLSQYAFPDEASFSLWSVPRRRHDETDKPLNSFGWQMQTPFADTRHMAFSFASITSRTESILYERQHFLGNELSPDEHMLLARTVIGNAFEHLGSRTVIALEALKQEGKQIRNLVVSGGVAANNFLRHYLRAMLDARGFEGVQLVFPPVQYCTDNAAMIAWTGLEMYKAGYASDLGIDAIRKWSMDATAPDGGILGVDGWYRLS